MNITDYRNRKNAGLVDLRAHGDGVVGLVVAQFDPISGQRIADQFGNVNVAGMDAERAQAQKNLDAAQAFKDDLEAFITDVVAADANFGKEPTAKAAKEK